MTPTASAGCSATTVARPAEFYAAGRDELAAYPTVEVRSGEVAGRRRGDGAGFVLELADGSRERGARACCSPRAWTTASPRSPGIAERWGRSVFHCPFCHGWEVRDQPLGVLDRGATGASERSCCASGATT